MIKVKSREKFLNKMFREIETITSEIPIGAEIGVLEGDFSQMILDARCPLLWLIDPFERGGISYNEGLGFLPSAYSTDEQFEKLCRRFYREIETAKVVVLRKYSYDALKHFVDGYFDFIYHDASHIYEDIKRDLNQWRQKIREGGIIAGHDYIDHPSFGVKQAVDEFMKEHNFEMIILNPNGGDYALRAIQ